MDMQISAVDVGHRCPNTGRGGVIKALDIFSLGIDSLKPVVNNRSGSHGTKESQIDP